MAFQELFKNYINIFNGDLILTFFVPSFSVLPAIFVLNKN